MSPVTKQKHALVRNGKAKGRGNEITGEDNFSRCPKHTSRERCSDLLSMPIQIDH